MGSDFALSNELVSYIQKMGVREHPILEKCRLETAVMGDISRMQIAPEQGALLALLAQLTGTRRYLEIGVFTGYSSLAVALKLPENARITACDRDEDFVARAQSYWKEAGVSDKIETRLGPAVGTLDAMIAEQKEPFDMAFIDADKGNYQGYYERALKLVRNGGLIAIDNVLWSGNVVNPEDQSPATKAIRAFNEKVQTDQRVDTCLVPIADGLFLCRKR